MKTLLNQGCSSSCASRARGLRWWVRCAFRILLLGTVTSWLSNCSSAQKPHNGRFPFSLLEVAPGAKRSIKVRGKVAIPAPMPALLSYDREYADSFDDKVAQLQPGDMIGFVMSHRESLKHLSEANIQKVPYEVFRYGHLALVTPDHKLLSIAMKQAVTADLALSTLGDQSWIAFRPPSGSVDLNRLAEFVEISTERASSTSKAYDYTGVLGLWNVEAFPESPDEIADEYTCTTLVLAALNYSGYRIDAVHRSGILDVVTPRQVIESSGWPAPAGDN